MSITSSTKFIVSLFLLIPLFLMIVWFGNGLIHGGGEEGILFYNPQKMLQLSTSVWAEYTTGNAIMVWLQQSPIMYLSAIFAKSGLQPFLFQATVFYILMVIGLFSVYYLTLNLLEENKNEKLISFVSAIFYLFNPFTLSQVWGRSLSAQYFAFALLPLALLLFCLGLKRKKYIFGVLLVLTSSILAIAYQFLTFIIVYWLVLLIYLIHSAVISKDRAKEAFFGIKFIFFISVSWLFLNFWWFAPLFLSFGNVNSAGAPSLESNLGTLLGVSRTFTLDVIVRLLQRGYFFDATAYSQIYSTIPFQLVSFIPLFFVIIGTFKLLRSREQIKFRFFVVLLILGLFVSLGANFPSEWLFVWLFKSFAFLQAFRNPFEKFGLVYVLGYSPIFAYGLVSFLEKKKTRKFLLVLILVLTCVVYAWPMWTGRVIAGYDKKIGLDIPTYYKDLHNWLKVQGNDFRLLMTPIWSSDSAFYQWNNAARYQGSDPMLFMMDQPVISNGAHGPYYYDFITNVRNYMRREDVVPALFLFRTKFLIDRKDAIFVTDAEKEQYKFLTSMISPPLGRESNIPSICQNIAADSKTNNLAWIVCRIDKESDDFSNVKYLHVKVKTDLPANLYISLRDAKDTRINWNGRIDSDYRTDTNDWQYITLPLNTATENNSDIDLSKISILEVQAYLKDYPEKSVGQINLSEIKLDPGTEKRINEFKQVAEFGKLTVFEPINFNPPPEFGSLSSIDYVQSFPQLFEQVDKKRDQIDKKGFILVSQNNQKNLQDLPAEAYLRVGDKYKISDTRYWLRVNKSYDTGLLVLSKTFHPMWKVIPGMSREKLSGNFFDDLNLLKAVVLPEDNHFVVNGYANLWKVNDKDTEYAIVFMPQIITDISSMVSKIMACLVLGIFIILAARKIAKKFS